MCWAEPSGSWLAANTADAAAAQQMSQQCQQTSHPIIASTLTAAHPPACLRLVSLQQQPEW
jgi:hypothetical protein